MDLKKKKLYVNITVVIVVILFLILFFTDHLALAVSILFMSGGILGLITRNIANYKASNNFPFSNKTVSYDEDSIAGPLLNIGFLILGLITFFISFKL